MIPSPLARLIMSPTALGALAGALLLTTTSHVQADVAYVRSTVGLPWDQTTNEQAMDLVFGAGNWADLRYETVDPAVLLSPAYDFIYMEGSDDNALEMSAFVTANITAIEAWVNAGGQLFMNAAPNEGTAMDWGFGGVVLTYPNASSTNPGSAVNPAHPIWNGPFLPVSTSFTGTAFAHATVAGPGATNIIQDAANKIYLIEMTYGNGRALFGGLTTTNWWSPNPDALYLRANIISYLDVVCGDSFIEGYEQCDDGNAVDNDDCTNACTLAACGDGVVWDQGNGAEACDDGNAVDNDDCTSACVLPVCGDGIVWNEGSGVEACDDGNGVDSDDCTNTCAAPVCGDGIVWNEGSGAEECDDGNQVDDDMCSNACERNAYCGDGFVDPGEACDDGAGNSFDPGACRPDCEAPYCGDNITDPGEACDQGINNNTSPDACRPDCAAPYCGDGIVDIAAGEACDEAANNDDNGPPGACNTLCATIEAVPGGGCCSTGDARTPGPELLLFGLVLALVTRRRRRA